VLIKNFSPGSMWSPTHVQVTGMSNRLIWVIRIHHLLFVYLHLSYYFLGYFINVHLKFVWLQWLFSFA